MWCCWWSWWWWWWWWWRWWWWWSQWWWWRWWWWLCWWWMIMVGMVMMRIRAMMRWWWRWRWWWSSSSWSWWWGKSGLMIWGWWWCWRWWYWGKCFSWSLTISTVTCQVCLHHRDSIRTIQEGEGWQPSVGGPQDWRALLGSGCCYKHQVPNQIWIASLDTWTCRHLSHHFVFQNLFVFGNQMSFFCQLFHSWADPMKEHLIQHYKFNYVCLYLYDMIWSVI